LQVVSGSIGKEKVHYEAPYADILEKEMADLIDKKILKKVGVKGHMV